MTSVEASAGVADAEAVFSRYRQVMSDGLRQALTDMRQSDALAPATKGLLSEFYGQIEYHLGWRQPDLSPASANSGKYMRPALLLLSAELAAGRHGADASQRDHSARQAVPAAVSVELVHNFSLVHDDIEDGDEERRHRPTLWKLWGVPQAINTGDAIFSLARHALWRLTRLDVDAATVVTLAELLDRTCVELCEGQHLDMSYEGRQNVTVPMYLDMIGRKTASLMSCATEMGARIGAPQDEALAHQLAAFGRALGLAFQVRDDLLGVWATSEKLGKTPAGDVRRKKMSLPVLQALEVANETDRRALRAIYDAEGPASETQIRDTLAIFERTGARERVRSMLKEQSDAAQDALAAAAEGAPQAKEAQEQFSALVRFVAAAAR